MQQNFLNDDRKVTSAKSIRMDPAASTALVNSIQRARARAQSVLLKSPNDHNALLAMMIASGVQRDYLALVEHRLRESYDFIKESQAYASRLLNVDPTAYDAYLTQGFTEYLIASVPFYLRWFMKMDGITCTKEQGLEDLKKAALHGEHMKPFAQMLLAMLYSRRSN